MYYQRDIEEKIYKVIEFQDNHIILLSGARQTGKSTIIENLNYPKEPLILNFWDESDEIKALREARSLEELENYLYQFYKFKPTGEKILVIDEAQASNHLGKFLMQIHRTWNKQKLILSGSLLSNLYSEDVPIPTGRVVELICRPLNFKEFLRFREKENYLEALDLDFEKEEYSVDEHIHSILLKEYEYFLQIGGLPGIVKAFIQKQDFQLILESLLNNIYRDADRFIAKNSDIKRSKVVQYGSLVEHALKIIGHLVCSSSTNSSILSTDSPSYREVLPNALEALKSWHLVYTLSFDRKELSSKKGYSSKKYLFDTGILNYFINRFMPVSLESSSDVLARLLENMVLQELVSRAYSIRNITSYKKNNKSAHELDFVAAIDGKIFPIEVKSSSKITTKAVLQLTEFMDTRGVSKGFVIFTGKPHRKKIGKKDIYFLPPYCLNLIL